MADKRRRIIEAKLEELVGRAAALGLPALAVTDRDGVYGLPAAHVAAQELGGTEPHPRLIVGSQITVDDGTTIVLLAGDRSEGKTAVERDWTPAVDIREEDNRFVLEADIPGIEPSDIEITMENGVLTLRGRRESESRAEKDGYRRIERVTGRFFRRSLTCVGVQC
mgnify:CR=1 FL=1